MDITVHKLILPVFIAAAATAAAAGTAVRVGLAFNYRFLPAMQRARQLIEAGTVVGIRVLDHIIIGRGDTPHLSLREKGLATFTP